MIDIKVPAVGESISEVTLVKWLKQDGDWVDRDEVIAELESEKATFEVNAEKAGSLKTIGKEGDTLKIGDVLAQIDESAVKPVSAPTNGTTAPAKQEAIANAVPGKTTAIGEPAKPAGAVSNDVRATPVAAAIISDK